MPIPVEKIIERAKASGFDAELKVAAILRDAGWNVRQNVYYIDKDEKKGRELDISAYANFQQIDDKPETTCGLFLCVEVKRSADLFIFFTDAPSGFEPGTGYGILNWHKRIDRHVLSYNEIERRRPLRAVPRLARSYASFKDSKEQHIRSGVLSAFKGAVHMAENTDETYSDTSHDICFFLPIVVVDGPLYECHFVDGARELTAAPVDTAVYVQNYLSESYGDIASRVTVVTMPAFGALLAEYRLWGQDLLATMLANRDGYGG